MIGSHRTNADGTLNRIGGPRGQVVHGVPIRKLESRSMTPSMTPGDWVGIVKDLLVAGAAVAAAIMAWKGLTTWRRELHGKAKHEVARQMLRATYKVRDAVHHVRHPIGTGEEQIAGLRDGGYPDDEIARIVALWDWQPGGRADRVGARDHGIKSACATGGRVVQLNPVAGLLHGPS